MPRTPSSTRARANTIRLQIGGAIAAAIGLVLLSVPLAATAAPAPTPVTVAVRVDDGTSSAPLPGVNVTIRATDETGTVVGTGTTGTDGTVTIGVDGLPTSYIADAVWPGAAGDLEDTSARTEFRLGSPGPVEMTLRGTSGTATGTLAVTAGGQPVPSLDGAMAVISSGGVPLQRLPLSANGTFTSGALPSGSTNAYDVSLIPPSGYDLASEQPGFNPAFSLPSGQGGTMMIVRSFAVVPQGTTPTPTPTPTATPTPTPTPTPTATPTPTPTDPTPAVPVTIPGGTDLGTALGASTESQLNALLAATAGADNNPVLVTNDANQVLGFAQQPTPQQAAQVTQALRPVANAIQGVTINSIAFASMDIETALMMVQSERANLLSQQLASQIEAVQQRNAVIGALSTARNALAAYIASPTESTFIAATSALTAAGVSHAFQASTPAAGVELAKAASDVVRSQMDAASNSQQMDMLRLQSLTNKRNEAFDIMTNFVKKMQDSRTSIIGNMRSTPVAIGTVQWDGGAVTGRFDLSAVPDGRHHLILNVAGEGTTIVAEVTVQRGRLAATGGELTPAPWIGAGLLGLGLVAVLGAPVLRRRGRAAVGSDG